MENKELKGGRQNSIFKEGSCVSRPRNIWTYSVHQFLNFLHKEGIDFVPKPISLDDSTETVTYIEGEVYHYPLPKEALDDELLKSMAILLKRYHDVSSKFIEKKLDKNETWMLKSNTNHEVMCHGDIAPYNVTVLNGKAVGIIDFDTVHPGSKLWDITYACYRWVPLKNPKNPDSYFELSEQILRLKIFINSYGLNVEDKTVFMDVLINRLMSLTSYIQEQANNNISHFEKNIEDGHLKLYFDDIEYLKKNKKIITSNLLDDYGLST